MSKTRKRRIFGMTITQSMILICLALGAIVTIFGSFILISSSTTPGGLTILPSPAPTLPVAPTIPPDLLEIPGVASTATLVLGAYEIPPDWKQYSATTIEVKVPPQFIASENVDKTRQERIDLYRSQGFEFLAARLDDDSFDYRFWFDFRHLEEVTFGTHIYVKADILPTLTLSEYVDEAYGAGLQGFQVIERQAFNKENLQAERVLLEASLNGTVIRVADYIITDEVNLWIISGGSRLDDFSSWLPVFDRVATSFRLLY